MQLNLRRGDDREQFLLNSLSRLIGGHFGDVNLIRVGQEDGAFAGNLHAGHVDQLLRRGRQKRSVVIVPDDEVERVAGFDQRIGRGAGMGDPAQIGRRMAVGP